MSDKHVPLKRPYRDRLNVEHDMAIGPCACGAWHDGHNPPPAMMAFKPASPWIPVTAEKPLPESGEALVEYVSGAREHWRCLGNCNMRVDVVAYQMIEPFATPEPEQPKRLNLWCVVDDVDVVRTTFQSREAAIADCKRGRKVECRVVNLKDYRDGDVDPDAAIAAREYAERNLGVGHTFAARDILEILNGGQQ